MTWWWIGLALAGRWDGHPSDIEAQAVIDAPPEQLYEVLVDLRSLEALLPDHCATDFVYGERTVGEGATVRLTYHADVLHRRLDATLTRAEEPRLVDVDHAGNKGFVTRFVLAPEADGTRVTMTSFLNPPPWPFRRVFYTRVRPAWTQCYLDALAELQAVVATD